MKKIKSSKIFKEKWLNWANSLSILRLLLLFPFLYYGTLYARNPHSGNLLILIYVLLLCIALSDFFDGILARHFGQKTHLGHYLDPACDKIVGISGFTFLWLSFNFPLYFYLAYLLREILSIYFSAFLLMKRKIQVKPNYWGKVGVALATLLVSWYIAIPWLYTTMPDGHWLLYPQPLLYIWAIVLLGGIVTYIRTYRKILFIQ